MPQSSYFVKCVHSQPRVFSKLLASSNYLEFKLSHLVKNLKTGTVTDF